MFSTLASYLQIAPWPPVPGAIFWAALFVVGGALLGEVVNRRFGVPRIVGYSAVGMLIALTGHGVARGRLDGLLGLIVDLALALLLFEVGSRVRLRWLRTNPALLLTSAAESLLGFAAVVAVLRLLDVELNIALACAVMTVSASGAVIGRVATELGAAGQVTERMIVLTALNTLYAVLANKLMIGWIHLDVAGHWIQGIAQPLYTFCGSALIAAALAKVVATVMRKLDLRDENSVLLLLGLIALAVTCARLLNLSTLLVPLMAGVILRNTTERPWVWPRHFGTAGGVVVMLAHLLREGLYCRYSGFRRLSWLTGVVLLPLTYVNAIGGFWLNWDQLGQFSAIATAEWLDWLPLFGSPLARNFLVVSAVTDRLFSLFVFVHIGVPLLLAFGLWFHVHRVAHPMVFPPWRLAAGAAGTLLTLALAAPVLSQAPANLMVAPTVLAYDWLLLFVHPLIYSTSAAFAWFALASTLLALLVLPLLSQPARAPVALVDAANCNGCRRCFDDCPYAAVTMVAHPTRGIRELAQVNADLCASCGICAGACPSASPFRSVAELVTGIDMPSAPIGVLRGKLVNGLASLGNQPHKIAVFGCDHGADVRQWAGPDVVAFSLLCAGQLPPSFIEYALRDGAAGVLVTGCGEASCEYRLGQRWTAERLQGMREPHLRASVPRERIALVNASESDPSAVRDALQSLRERVWANPAPAEAASRSVHG